MKLRELLVRATNELSGRRIDNPNLEAEVLLLHVLDLRRDTFFASLDEDLTIDQETLVLELVTQRASGTPLAYLTGHREFFGLDFVVNPSVLIPRQETELLVEKVLDLAKHHTGEALTVVDVGTGVEQTPPAEAYHTILSELAQYSSELAAKEEFVVGNKIDLTGGPESALALAEAIDKAVLPISAVAGLGLPTMLETLWSCVQHARSQPQAEQE